MFVRALFFALFVGLLIATVFSSKLIFSPSSNTSTNDNTHNQKIFVLDENTQANILMDKILKWKAQSSSPNETILIKISLDVNAKEETFLKSALDTAKLTNVCRFETID